MSPEKAVYMTQPPTGEGFSEKVRAIYEVGLFRPLLATSVVGLSVIVAALEGVGMGFILPIIQVSQRGAGQQASGLVQYFIRAYSFLGLPFELEFIILGVGFVIAVRYTLSFVVRWMGAVLRMKYIEHLRRESFASALDAEIAYFDQEGSDNILNSIITQTKYAGESIQYFLRVLELSTISLAYIVLAFYLSPMLTLVTGVLVGGLMYGIRAYVESGYEVGSRVADANEYVQETVQAGMQGIRDVKLFNLQNELLGNFEDAIGNYTTSMVTQFRNRAAINNANQFLTAAAVFALIFVGLEIASLSIGALGLFLFLMFRLGPRLSNLNDELYGLENNLPHLVRAQRDIEEFQATREDEGSNTVSTPITKIEFRSVDFHYDTSDEQVLDDISLEVDRGEFVALVGPSGAGKSTVVSLLARMYDPDKGQIIADGTSIKEFDIKDWRSRISVVRQNPYIFNDTLRFNLTVGNRQASPDEVDRMCRIARVDEFFDELPDGYDTVLGDQGVRLSGGQKQRVAIARALLKGGDFLVLDEATSDLDSHLEKAVHRGIETMEQDVGIIAIAHRLSTITDADRIYMMENGAIVEKGRHDELVASEGKYADLYRTQIRA